MSALPVYGVVGSNSQQIGGSRPEGWVVMHGGRPSPEHFATEGGIWIYPEPSTESLCARIDTVADTARARVAGDPLRAVEYDRARIAAEQFAAAGYQGDVPPMVAAWAINGRTAQQAADEILHEAAQYTAALIALRETRLAAKEQVRILMAVGDVDQAQQVVEQTVAAIEEAVAGIGNNAG